MPLHFNKFKKLRQAPDGRAFAVGDVHGCLEELMALLNKINFNEDCDTIVFLGDIGDRGPRSFEAFNFVLSKPCFHLVAGNHEDLLVEHIENGTSLPSDMMEFWLEQEGGWTENVSHHQLNLLASKLKQQAYCAIEFEANDGTRIGITHAGYDNAVWFQPTQCYEDKIYRMLMWSRMRAEKESQSCSVIEGIDFTVHGHTIFREATQKANSLFIDTGCCIGGNLTALNLNAFSETNSIEKSISSVKSYS